MSYKKPRASWKVILCCLFTCAGSRNEQREDDLPVERSTITIRLNGHNYTCSSITNQNIREIKKALLKKVLKRSLTADELSKYVLIYNGNRLDESKTAEDLHLSGKIVECIIEGLWIGCDLDLEPSETDNGNADKENNCGGLQENSVNESSSVKQTQALLNSLELRIIQCFNLANNLSVHKLKPSSLEERIKKIENYVNVDYF